jgi:hypothetical protein
MPEINPFKDTKFIKEISKEKEKENLFRNPEGFEKISEKFGIKKLGSGNECFVVDDPESKEKVIAISFNNLSPEEAKDVYYSSKIWSTLFPHNFPKIYSVSAETDDNKFNGSIRQKIHGKTLADQNYNYARMMNADIQEKRNLSSAIKNIKNYLLNKNTETQYPFANTLQEMKILSNPPYNLPFFIDINGKNFIKNDDGDEYYVDTIKMGEQIKQMNTEINTESVMEHMREKGYDESDIAKVTGSIKRLNAIFITNDQKE